MGRHSKYREFFTILCDGLGTDAKGLATATGKQTANVSQYLSGTKTPGKVAAHSAARHLAEWRVVTHYEVSPLPPKLSVLPKAGGIYVFYDSGGNVIYLGQAKSLQTEIKLTLARQSNFPVRSAPKLSKKKHPLYRDLTTHFSAYEVESPRLRHNLEALLLRAFPNQTHNNKLGEFW